MNKKNLYINYTNSELIDLLKQGDNKVFEKVYKYFFSPLVAFATQYTSLEESEEITQETMLWLWENRDSLQSDRSLKSLLFTIVKNKCLNIVSHNTMKSNVLEKIQENFATQFEDIDLYDLKELKEQLRDALFKLPPDYRKAFEMSRFQNLTYNQIATIENVSSKTINYRITQALKILRKELKDYLPLLLFLS